MLKSRKKVSHCVARKLSCRRFFVACSRSFTTAGISIIAAGVNDSGRRKVQTQPKTVMETANNVHSFTRKETEGRGGRESLFCNLGVGSSLCCPVSCVHMQKVSTSKLIKSGLHEHKRAKQRKSSDFTEALRRNAAAAGAALKQTKWKSCIRKKCLLPEWPLCFRRLK